VFIHIKKLKQKAILERNNCLFLFLKYKMEIKHNIDVINGIYVVIKINEFKIIEIFLSDKKGRLMITLKPSKYHSNPNSQYDK